MKRNSIIKVIFLVIMALFSLTNLFGAAVSGISVIIGIVGFFVLKTLERKTFPECGFDFKLISKEVRKPGLWMWMLLPSMMNILVIIFAEFILLNYIEHVLSRSQAMLKMSTFPILIIQLFVFALGEEIAWRGFFQKHIQSFLPVNLALLISSALFSLGHIMTGSFIIVSYDVLFIFINSLIYGMIFIKTNNVWVSALSHFSANLLAVIILLFL
ncbi:MAG: CPBP family intramembrane metalloprotease [Tissierellales bacterium]|nr:CPBP family intramembrane metalloprotease [Tissierellales bacterium]MBN2827164.1 CPBP family intramembrane metalloprotease [Tissierellales bacterium]